jgi:hypothetical protein
MRKHWWFQGWVRELAVVIAIALLSGVGVVPALAEETRMVGFVMDVDKTAATLEVERHQGDFVTLHLNEEARWILKKIEVGDRVHAVVENQDGRLVAKEVSFQIGPTVQVDMVQGVVTRTNPRDHSIEVKTLLGTDEVLFLDQSSLGILGRLAAGDGIEARVETVIEEGGVRKVVRTILIGKGF